MGARARSITQSGQTEPFDLQVSRGDVGYHYPIQINGYSATVGSTAFGPLWEGLTSSGGAYVYPGSASQLTIVSTSASDGTSLSVQVNGLDANYNMIYETIALNGTANVITVKSYFRINSIVCTNGLNVGTITAKIGATVYAQINPGIGQTQMGLFTVPANMTFCLIEVVAYANIGFTSSAYLLYQESNTLNISSPSNYNGYPITNAKNTTVLNQSPFVQFLQLPCDPPIIHPGGTDIQYQFKASTGTNTIANVVASGYLIANDTLTF